jgi:heme exporter protein CcmD
MNWTADHAGFVVAAYAISALAIAGLIAWVLMRDRAARRDLDKHQ